MSTLLQTLQQAHNAALQEHYSKQKELDVKEWSDAKLRFEDVKSFVIVELKKVAETNTNPYISIIFDVPWIMFSKQPYISPEEYSSVACVKVNCRTERQCILVGNLCFKWLREQHNLSVETEWRGSKYAVKIWLGST